MLRFFCATFAIITIPAIAAPKKAQDNPDKMLIQKVQQQVVGSLKDPESAKFQNIYVKWGTVCGEVNARNSYGGYVGFQPFYSIDGDVLRMKGNAHFESGWEKYCSSNAKKPEPPKPYHEAIYDTPEPPENR
ncbi:MAG: hypothetical protein K2X55_27330 [Burkholderiaceae bacterium]|nr:hypothetical protein [Burkholderiaceae bacterium]